ALVDGRRFHEDPSLGPTPSEPCDEASIGDIVSANGDRFRVRIHVDAAAPIAQVDVLVGTDVAASWRPPGRGRRISVRWEGALYRGRGREVSWDGDAHLEGAAIREVTRINAFNPAHALTWDANSL